MELQIKILQKIVDILIEDYNDIFLAKIKKLLSNRKRVNEPMLSNILYGIISLYLIDEIATQPIQKMNFIDMGSFYYRSESYNIDFPSELHSKYKIANFHLDRNVSIFYSWKEFICNYLHRKPMELFGSIGFLVDNEPDFKMPCSRQYFLIEYFLQYPESFFKFFNAKYNSKFKKTKTYKIRKKIDYGKFLLNRIVKDEQEEDFKYKLEGILDEDSKFVLTFSGTAANQLSMQFFDKHNNKSFYHNYWYYENLGEKRANYFYEIEHKAKIYDNFFFCLRPTNYIDLKNPGYIENIENCLNSLVNKLKDSKKNHNLIIDITPDLFYKLKIETKNIDVIKTMSLSKYQEGINTSFAGLVIGSEEVISKMTILSDRLGFTLKSLDKKFLCLPQINKFRKRLTKIEEFNNVRLPDYKKWKVLPIGLSVILIPSEEIIDLHLMKFTNQNKIKDRPFSWILRDRVNELINKLGIKNMFIRDSFLFPDSSMNMQGPRINSRDYGKYDHKFKYRLPRISPGYTSCDLKNIDIYYEFYKGIIDIYMEEYNNL